LTFTDNHPSVVLVDFHDNQIGVAEKLEAHRNGGRLHRAFSIFLLNDQCQLLLQRRAPEKYHCPGMWSNSCCGHPRPGRDIVSEAELRLQVEIGVAAEIQHVGTVSYRFQLDNGLTEWELDHLFVGRYTGTVSPNREEVDAVQWISERDLYRLLREYHQSVTPWFSLIMSRFSRKVLEVKT